MKKYGRKSWEKMRSCWVKTGDPLARRQGLLGAPRFGFETFQWFVDVVRSSEKTGTRCLGEHLGKLRDCEPTGKALWAHFQRMRFMERDRSIAKDAARAARVLGISVAGPSPSRLWPFRRDPVLAAYWWRAALSGGAFPRTEPWSVIALHGSHIAFITDAASKAEAARIRDRIARRMRLTRVDLRIARGRVKGSIAWKELRDRALDRRVRTEDDVCAPQETRQQKRGVQDGSDIAQA